MDEESFESAEEILNKFIDDRSKHEVSDPSRRREWNISNSAQHGAGKSICDQNISENINWVFGDRIAHCYHAIPYGFSDNTLFIASSFEYTQGEQAELDCWLWTDVHPETVSAVEVVLHSWTAVQDALERHRPSPRYVESNLICGHPADLENSLFVRNLTNKMLMSIFTGKETTVSSNMGKYRGSMELRSNGCEAKSTPVNAQCLREMALRLKVMCNVSTQGGIAQQGIAPCTYQKKEVDIEVIFTPTEFGDQFSAKLAPKS